jgi:hypothetical protein
MKRSIIAVVSVSIGLYCVPLLASGAPARVHLFDAAAMLLAFTIPNLVIVSVARKKLAWIAAIVLHAATAIGWLFLMPLVVVKAEPSILAALMLLPISITALCAHSGLAHVVSRCIAFPPHPKNA